MKKFAKMSLVAAIAVAGTVASAQPLAEAIKNVDVSGTVVYRYDDKNIDENIADNSTTSNNYKVAVSLKSKVTDDVTFNSRILVANADGGFVAGLDTQAAADANPGVALSHANFAYTGIANTTVVVGKQGLATPWTKAIDSDGDEETGTGILASTTVGPVTAAAGYFNQTNLDQYAGNGAENVMVAALLGSVGPVNLQAWYLDLDTIFDAYYVKADASFDIDAVKLGLFAQYSDRDSDGVTGDDDVNLLKTGISAKMGIFNAGVTYAKTGDQGSSIVNAVSANSAIGYTVNMASATNSDAYFIDLGVQATDSLHVALNYDKISDDDANNADDHKETYLQLSYDHAKNLSAYIRLADGEDGEQDYKRGRLQVQYSF